MYSYHVFSTVNAWRGGVLFPSCDVFTSVSTVADCCTKVSNYVSIELSVHWYWEWKCLILELFDTKISVFQNRSNYHIFFMSF